MIFYQPNMLHIDRLTHIGRVNRVDVYVHWSVFAIVLLMLWGVLERPLTTLIGISCWMGVMFLHECGHMLAAQRRRSHVFEITLYPVFAFTRFAEPWSRLDHAIIKWGGVLAQLFVALPCLLWINFVGYTPFEAANAALAIFGPFSVAIAIFNLLPFEPLDGKMAWQIVPAVFERVKRRKTQRAAGWRTYR
jgi:hypothetical protein